MLTTIPGTMLPFEEGLEQNAFAVLTPLLSVTRGLTLSQISEVTGLQGSTIQNWVKRGWVANPKNRRYEERQVARVILINMLKSSLQLETIVSLMKYVNGSVEDAADDIIPDRELFNMLCRIIFLEDAQHSFDRDALREIIRQVTADYEEPVAGARERLTKALEIMTLAYLSGEVQRMAQDACNQIGI